MKKGTKKLNTRHQSRVVVKQAEEMAIQAGAEAKKEAESIMASEKETGAKAAGAEVSEQIIIQFGELEADICEVSKKVKAKYQEEGGSGIKDLKIYVKPEENKAYYVVNGDATGDVDLV